MKVPRLKPMETAVRLYAIDRMAALVFEMAPEPIGWAEVEDVLAVTLAKQFPSLADARQSVAGMFRLVWANREALAEFVATTPSLLGDRTRLAAIDANDLVAFVLFATWGLEQAGYV